MRRKTPIKHEHLVWSWNLNYCDEDDQVRIVLHKTNLAWFLFEQLALIMPDWVASKIYHSRLFRAIDDVNSQTLYIVRPDQGDVPYLSATINELRMHSVVSANDDESKTDDG